MHLRTSNATRTPDSSTAPSEWSYTPIGDVPMHSRYGLTSRNKSRLAKLALGAVALLAVGSLAVSSISTTSANVTQHTLRASADARSSPSVSTVTATAKATATATAPSGAQSTSAFPGATDEIVDLHGKPESYTSRLFSGYLPISNGGEAFYFFAESQSTSAQSDPVLLWLNGGPGASSLAGCFSENGPLLVNDDGVSLRVNDHAWNQNANFVCIESPIGVGFSYNASGVYVSDDVKQADELYEALQQFLTKFPWLRSNDFIVSGESYGGVYVPMTAKRIVEGNAKGDAPKINLKKFVVGNGVNEFTGLSMILYAYYHGLIGSEDYRRVRSSCPEFQEFKPSPMFAQLADPTTPCAEAVMETMLHLFTTHVNSYNIYGTCAGRLEDDVMALIREVLAPAQGFPHPIGSPMNLCLNSTNLVSYFNIPAVRNQMHTNLDLARWDNDALTSASIDVLGKFIGLNDSDIANIKRTKLLDYTGTLGSVVTPLWKELLANGVQGVIYHGDVDMVCDFIGGSWAVESLQLPRRSPRSIWTVASDDGGDEQTAGFVEDYGNLTFLTVKGAGHLVPMWKPRESKVMLDRFVLDNEA
ncbi:hypothetical protein ATCC90586_007470 [Pythium insidiosum]|nr:hypothetical protein ATCC90586_007470 [Pythium insidiosum]